MKIQITQPVALYEKGGKEWNEDFIYPLYNQATVDEKLYIICDGEGGQNVGDVAAKLVALSFAKYFASSPPEGELTKKYLELSLRTAEEALSAYKEAHPENKAMATTLALLYLGEKQVTLAWVGNSRAYYFDSSNKLLIGPSQGGKEEGKITGADNPADIQTKVIPSDEISANDFFMLATDGIAEQADANTLETLLASDHSANPEFLLEEINNLTRGFTRDNYSCYLIKVAKVEKEGFVAKDEGAMVEETALGNDPITPPKIVKEDSGKQSPFMRNLLVGALLLIVSCLILIAWMYSRKSRYEKFMAKAEEYYNNENYLHAKDNFDSAIIYADNNQQRDSARYRRGLAQIKLELDTDLDYTDIPPPSELTLSAEEYIEEGNERMRAKNYLGALNSYLKAESKNQSAGLEPPPIPQDSVALAHMRIGNSYFENENHEKAANHYEKVKKLLESPEVNANLPDFQPLMARLQVSNEVLGRESGSEEPTSAQLADQTPPRSSNTRSLTPRTDNQTTNSSTGSQGAEGRISGINSPGIDPAAEAAMRKALSNGKRLYSQAKDQNSDYLFQQSALQLEQAAPILDGSGAYLLAYMYHIGKGVEADKKKALRYAQQSALKDWPAGHYLYAHLLLLRKYPRDSITARQSLKKASEQNFLEAINRLEALGNL